MLTDTIKSPNAKVMPLTWDAVSWTQGFWADAVKVNDTQTIPHLQKMFEAADISHVVENFRICANRAEGSFSGTVFGDGDFYKWMEAALYSAARTNNKELLGQIDSYIGLIGEAQLPDGYISTKQIIGERTGNGVTRHGDINDFEVYNFGHLFTTACLHKRITGKNDLFAIAEKAAGYLKNMYEEGAKKGMVQTAVCPSHYMGLIEMYRTSGNTDYLDLAKLAISLRDSVKDGMDDNQDRIPLKQHEKIIGHAVRANYLYAGLADLSLEYHDSEYISVLDKVWDNLVNQKLYITGGCGALYNGTSPYGNFFVDQKVHQAYGYEYQLPNITAYNETCASVGSVLWASRMFQLNPKAEYFDLIERTMLNVNLAAVSLDGKKFFYENMLRREKELPYKLVWPLTRSEYILSYCCPPNLARTIAESSEYAYMMSGDTLWTGLYGANHAKVHLPNGTGCDLEQITNYPYDGKIIFSFKEFEGDSFYLNIRIPKWAEKGYIRYGSVYKEIDSAMSGSYYTQRVDRTCQTLEVSFDMPVRYSAGNPLIEETNNQVAVERGPLVYCLETPDSSAASLNDLLLDLHAEYTPVPITICGRNMTALETDAYFIEKSSEERSSLYYTLKNINMASTHIRMIPYFAWDNREYGEMRIWIPIAYK